MALILVTIGLVVWIETDARQIIESMVIEEIDVTMIEDGQYTALSTMI